jgi:hypothetical protein
MGWTKIRLRRVTRSSTCVCLRICNYFVLLCATRVLALRARTGRLRRPDCGLRARQPHNLCPLPQWVFVPVWGSIVAALWAAMRYVWCCALVCARSARINAHSRLPTPITYAHCSNEWLYQFRPRSAQLFGRLCWMCNNTRTFARAALTTMRTRDRRPP